MADKKCNRRYIRVITYYFCIYDSDKDVDMISWYYIPLNLLNSEETERESERPKPTPPPRQSRSTVNVYHAPLPTPPPDDMEPQSVCFVQDDAVPLSSDMGSMSSKKSSLRQITSGSKTYRITPESGSPPRPCANRLFVQNSHGLS